MVLASTEYTFDLPVGTRQFLIKLRDTAVVQFGYVSGSPYIEIPRGCFLAESDLLLTATTTIYFQSPSANQVAEILVWT